MMLVRTYLDRLVGLFFLPTAGIKGKEPGSPGYEGCCPETAARLSFRNGIHLPSSFSQKDYGHFMPLASAWVPGRCTCIGYSQGADSLILKLHQPQLTQLGGKEHEGEDWLVGGGVCPRSQPGLRKNLRRPPTLAGNQILFASGAVEKSDITIGRVVVDGECVFLNEALLGRNGMVKMLII